MPKPLDSSNSFGITLTDKAGKRELRSAYATPGSTISINSALSPDKVKLSFTTTTTIDKNGNSLTNWQISLVPTLDSAPEPEPSLSGQECCQTNSFPIPSRFQAYKMGNSSNQPSSHRPRVEFDPGSTSPRSVASSYPPPEREPERGPVVVQVVEPTPGPEMVRWSGSESSMSALPSREEAALALGRSRRRMMSKWSDTEGESDQDNDTLD